MCKPSFQYDNTPMAEAIAECIHNDLHREILHDALINGWSYERIAEKTGMSSRHISRIMGKNVPLVREWMRQKMS